MTLTDNELGMIEQLCYLNKDVAEAAGVSGFTGVKAKDGHKSKSIAEILEVFDEDALNKLEALGNKELDGACASAKEWADIIRYLKSSERISGLVLSETMVNSTGTTLALCFTESANSDSAIVAFKGTSGGSEWIDNVEGMNTSDTQCQKDALDFIESLRFSNITVTGHSKGGNKAMYVAITSDKVTRCVSYDGQGFSQEFIDKYWAEIQECGRNITNYSLSTDYVHALLFPVPNSKQVYCKGYGVDNIKQHHSPNSFFVTDEKGNLILDENGNPMVISISEDESIMMLHDFTIFVINNADDDDKRIIVDYVSQLLAKVFGGEDMSTDELIDFLLSDQDTLALIIAYLIKYMDDNDLSAEDIDKLLKTLGLDSLDEMFTVNVMGVDIVGLSGLLDYIKKQLTDEDDDWFITNILLPLLKKLKFKDLDFDVTDFWNKVNSKIKTINTDGGTANATAKTGSIRDFSLDVNNTLMSAIRKIENMSFASVASWSSYSSEEWYSSLLVSIAIKGFSTYFSKLTQTNSECKTQIETIFSNVSQADTNGGNKMKQTNSTLQTMKINLRNCANGIG